MPKTSKSATLLLVLIALAALLVAAANPQAYAKPTGVAVYNTGDGHVSVRWDKDQAPVHRVGWVDEQELQTATLAGDGLEAFHFADTKRDSDYVIKDLPAGRKYWFIVGAASERFGQATWSDWVSLTTAGKPASGQPNSRYGLTPTVQAVETAINALPWVQDGLTTEGMGVEDYPVLGLRDIASQRPMLVWDLIHRPWMQDELSISESDALGSLFEIAVNDAMAAEQIARIILFDSVERDEVGTLQQLAERGPFGLDAEGLRWLVSQPALAGSGAQILPATVALLQLEWLKPDAATAVRDWPWVEDGIDDHEVHATVMVAELALVSDNLFWFLANTSWVADGLTPDEVSVLVSLNSMSGVNYAKQDEATALRIAAMPFLEEVDGVDAAAARSLFRLFAEPEEEDHLKQVLDHPIVRDGITDDEAFLVVHLGDVATHRPDLLDTVLDLGVSAVEKRTVQLPLAGEVTLSVVNMSPGDYDTIDRLERIIRAQEAFMNVPFPKRYAGLLVGDIDPRGGGGGPSGVFHVDPQYAEDDYIISHELAHTYWGFAPRWMQEGPAEFMSTFFTSYRVVSDYCQGYTLSEVAQLPDHCNYILGRDLFLDLYDTVGDEAFRQGFARLYLSMRDEALYDECAGSETGLCYLIAAFVADANPEAANLAEPVITRWYYGPR